MDVVGTILGCIPTIHEYTAAPIKQHLSYAFKYHTKVDELKDAADKLSGQRNQLQNSIDDARRQARVIYSHVQGQMAKADKAIEDARALIGGEEEEAKQRCFFGMCPNLKRRYKLGKKADKERKKADEETLAISHLLEKRDLDTISFQPPLQQIIRPHAPEGLESRAEILKKVIAALENPDVNMVGLYGQGGVGKTYLAKQVHQQATLNKSLFEDVVMVTVSSTPELQKIQEYIVDFLGLKDFPDLKTNDARASRLKQRLEKRKVLLILDDLWKKLNLEDLGILFGTEEFRNCKILLTSRFQLIMREMEAQVTEGLQPLSDEESYLLLGQIVGADELKMVGSTGEEIAKKCVGLPLLIDMNGKYLKGRPLPAWEDKLNKLSNFSDDVLEEKIFKSIELHYNNLVGEEIKSLFLLCGLLGEFDISIFDLLKYSVGLGLFRRINTLKDARNRLETLTEDLKSSSLLMNHEKIGFVKIHDMVREAATRIASRDKGVYTMAKDEVWKEWPTKIPGAERCGWIYIPWRNIHKLPEKLEAPEVQLLALLNKRGYPEAYLNVPDSLFGEVNAELKVVHFAGAYFPSTLPPLLRFLTNLHTLCLENCHVNDVAIIGEMKKLQVLSLRGSDIEQLPKELVHLTQLKLLDLKRCYQLRVIPPEVLSSLSSLEELYIGFLRKVNWAIQGSNKKQSNASLAELECLCRLTTLELGVPDGRMLPERLHTKKLERYWIQTQDHGTTDTSIFRSWTFLKEFGDENPRILILENLDTSIYRRDWLQILMRRATDLRLKNMKELGSIGIPSLKYLDNSGDSFSKLRDLKVEGCHQLKHLFSISMVRSLSQLWKLEVRNCCMIGEIVADNEGEDGNTGNEAVELTKLSSLTLHGLPELKSFCSRRLKKLLPQTVHMSSTTQLTVSENDDNTRLPLFDDMFVLPSLKELHIESCNSIEVIYHLQESSVNKTNDSIAGFQLRILRTISLRKLVHIWSVDLPGTISLKNLRCLVFPQLTELVLDNLPELISFCTDHMLSIEWPQLKFLQATGCEKVIRCTLEQFNAQKSSGKAQCMIQIQHHLFLSEKGFPNCEKMILDGWLFMGMMMQPSKFQLPSVKSLVLRSRIGWWARYAESSLWLHIQRLPNLRELTLEIRQLRELMLYPHEGQGGGRCLKALATHRIPNIRVRSNDALIRIMNKTELENFATNPYIERVEFLWLEDCLILENVAPTLVSNFSSLTSLIILGCHRLVSLVTISVATSLVQLKEMDIRNCRMLREILAFDDAAATNNAMQENIVFPKLKTLTCYNLPSLRGFYMGSHITLEFPSLKWVDSSRCPKMNVFSCGTLKTPKLEGDLNSTIRDKCLDYFRYIWTLKLDPSFPWLVEQWHCEQLLLLMKEIHFLQNLNTLVVDSCSHFLFAVPWNLLSSLTTLKSLSIERCDSLENVFDPEKLKNEELRHVESVALLKHLHLVDLPKLRNVWNKDPHGILNIRNLQVLKVHNCGNLTELFTLSMALDLVHLRELEVKQCTFLQVVIKKEEDEQVASNSTVFPSLQSLYLEYLPSLTSLCSGGYVLNFKGLCKVALVECPNMRICAFTPTTEEGDPRDIVEGNEEDSRNYLCFLGCKVEVSNIQELKFEWNNLLVMWTANNQAEFLKNLEVLELLHFSEEGLNSVSDLLQKFSKLKRLVLNSWFLEKIVLSSFNIKDGNRRSYERVLILTSLPCLNHLMVEDPKPIRDFKYPNCLEVSNCNILSILVLPSVYFETLTTLEVSKCHGLVNLIASSTARSMVHLKMMTISECEMVKEIVESEEDDTKAEICFRRLYCLQLHCLPCLTSFCSRDICFAFPSLEGVVIIGCPKMKTFVPNILSAPLVRGVQITEGDDDGARWLWEGSLNSTIEGLYMEMNS